MSEKRTRRRLTFGSWHWDPDAHVLSIGAEFPFEVSLPADMAPETALDAILTVRFKKWATPEVVFDFLTALNAVWPSRTLPVGVKAPGGLVIVEKTADLFPQPQQGA